MLAMVLVLVLAIGAQGEDTRTFDGIGSVGSDSTVEFYLLEGSYRHSLSADNGCFVAASVFPARNDLGVPLADVLQADLSTGTPGPGGAVEPAGLISITRGGWAHLQVGTGAACGWRYVITGEFLPPGEEPVSADERNQWWLVIAAAFVGGLASLLWLRRKTEPQSEEPVRTLPPRGSG